MLAKTCSDKCRQKRTRRLRRTNENIAKLREQGVVDSEITDLVRTELTRRGDGKPAGTPRKSPNPTGHVSQNLIRQTIADELRPVVREALTEDVLRSIDKLVNLTPRAVEAIADDLESDNAAIRQRAYLLVTKYTIGHPALVRQEDTDPNRQLTVNFHLPRPDAPEAIDVPPPSEDEDLRTCDLCGEAKQPEEFVADSERCLNCAEEWKAKVQEQFG